MSRLIMVLSLSLILLLSACNIPLEGQVDVVPTLAGNAGGETQEAATNTPAPSATPEPEDTVEPTDEPAPEDMVEPTDEPTPVRVDPTPVKVKPTRQPTQSPFTSLNAFGQELARAVENRDFPRMRELMGDRFSIATFNTQLMNYPAGQALDMLRADKFASGSAPAVRFGTDVVMLLNGTDPLDLWGPVDDPVRALHVMGLASNGSEEGVLVIGRDADSGDFYWLGILLPEDRYFQSEGPEDVTETDVEWVEALEILNARSGPGLNFAVEGQLRKGEIARVTGITSSGQWWQISCTQDSSGHCYISAASDLTRPTSAP